MIKGGQSILRFFSSQELRDFFQNWFGNELGLPAPLFLAFLAKGTEFTANLNYQGDGNFIRHDGLITISSFLFACLIAQSGAGKYSLDRFVFKNKPG